MALNRLLKGKRKALLNEINVGILKQLGALEKGITAFVLKHPRLFKLLLTPQLRKQPELFALFSNNITLTSLDCDNDVVNIIPPKITALLDCRLLPGQSTDAFLQKVKKRLKNKDIEINALHEGPEMDPSGRNNQFFTYYQDAVKAHYPDNETVAIMMPSTNDSGRFRAKGIPAYTSIPILIGREHLACIHNYNERIPLAALDQGRAVYTDFQVRCMGEYEARPQLADKK